MAWLLVFVLGMVMTNKMPTASHIALVPLAAFALGSVLDIFRRKSRAPLLVSSVAGFAAASFISWYHFFLFGAVMNFDRSGILIAPLLLMVLVAMPMLLAWASKRDLNWWPAKWLLIALLAACTVQYFTPGFSAERPRDMNLMYSETEGSDTAYVVLESLFRTPDRHYAKKHLFETARINSGRLGTVERPVREVEPLGLPGVILEQAEAVPVDGKWRRELTLQLPQESPYLLMTLPLESGLSKAWVNGELALDTSLETKRSRSSYRLRLINPREQSISIELLTDRDVSFSLATVVWHELPPVLVAPFMGNWPDDAQPYLYGPRAEKIQEFEIR